MEKVTFFETTDGHIQRHMKRPIQLLSLIPSTKMAVPGAHRAPLQDMRKFGMPQQAAHVGRVADQPCSGLSHGGPTLGEIPPGVIKCGT